jgi:phosphoribosyl 1,2-cyclic phosphodiesterase
MALAFFGSHSKSNTPFPHRSRPECKPIVEAAELLQISQPRVSALLHGKIDKFRLDSLVDMAHRLGLDVSLRLAS